MIKSLKLLNFRQFKKRVFEFNKNIIVVIGKNTRGKSSLLEAIYYLTTGNSPWSENKDIFNIDDNYFRIEALVEEEGHENTFAIYRDDAKRNYQIDGKNTSTTRFFKRFGATIFSPEQIEILLISPSKRREFLDDSLKRIDPIYKEQLDKYKKLLRHRNSYIKKLSKNFYETGVIPPYDNQIKYWSEELGKVSARLLQIRNEYLHMLKDEDFRMEYISSLELETFEELMTPESLAKMYSEAFVKSFKKDVALSHTNIGAHRDDWNIITSKDVKRFGSRGEKRLAIIKLMYLTHKVYTQKKGFKPILMLDDIPSELDDDNIKKIFKSEIFNEQQTFITAIREDEIPEEIISQAQVIYLD
ncbi:MAG TPA: DNA replication and repair protein RecF [Candidatus Dojkabacteria bacterium]|nr:DNA replication and repair protein RecF [Candidatus Dojkabacteria bacterium]